MMIRMIALACAIGLMAGPSAAEITGRTEDSFTLSFARPVPASPEAILTALGRPAAWWSSAHTYSGDAANLSLELRPGGCWCEALPGGGVQHGEVVMVWPERGLIRLNAPFGPLQAMGADAVLTLSWAAVEGQPTQLLTWTFVVHGPGVGAMAEPVHGVMTEHFGRLAAALGVPAS